MSYPSNLDNIDSGMTSVLGFDTSSSLDPLKAQQNDAYTHAATTDKNQVYNLDELSLNDELHIFCENSYIVLRKTENSIQLETSNDPRGPVDTEVSFTGISLAPNDYYKKSATGIFVGGWIHLTTCMTFRPDKLEDLPVARRALIGNKFILPEKLPIAKLEKNLKNGTMIVGRNKKPYYRLLVPNQGEYVFGPITDIILM